MDTSIIVVCVLCSIVVLFLCFGKMSTYFVNVEPTPETGDDNVDEDVESQSITDEAGVNVVTQIEMIVV